MDRHPSEAQSRTSFEEVATSLSNERLSRSASFSYDNMSLISHDLCCKMLLPTRYKLAVRLFEPHIGIWTQSSKIYGRRNKELTLLVGKLSGMKTTPSGDEVGLGLESSPSGEEVGPGLEATPAVGLPVKLSVGDGGGGSSLEGKAVGLNVFVKSVGFGESIQGAVGLSVPLRMGYVGDAEGFATCLVDDGRASTC